MAIWAAVSGTGIREQPTVTIVAKAETTRSPTVAKAETTTSPAVPTLPDASTDSTIEITASALSLASRDRMLLRVVAFPATASLETASRQCRDTRQVSVEPEAGGAVLFWGVTGPSATGSGEASVTLSVSQSDYRYLCALAVLSAKASAANSESTRVIVDLRNLEPLPPVD